MAATPGESLLNASVKDKQSLKDIHELLNRLFVRNRNQHRRNHWFKSLHQFRKQLGLLVDEAHSTKKVSAAKTIVERLQLWDAKYVHQWYLHFSQLVAVGPFSAIGLVLMACVARVCRITGITALYEDIASEAVRGVLTAVDDGTIAHESGALPDNEVWDEGEVIARED